MYICVLNRESPYNTIMLVFFLFFLVGLMTKVTGNCIAFHLAFDSSYYNFVSAGYSFKIKHHKQSYINVKDKELHCISDKFFDEQFKQ